MLDLEEVKAYLRVCDNDSDLQIQQMMLMAETYLDSICGEGYKKDPKLVKLSKILLLKLIADLYECRGSTIEGNLKQDRFATNIIQILSVSSEE